MTDLRNSHILPTYQFRAEIPGQATSMRNTKRLKSDEKYLQFREEPLVYMRDIYRHMQNEIGGQTWWGEAGNTTALENRRNEKVTMAKGEMIHEEPFHIGIIYITEK